MSTEADIGEVQSLPAAGGEAGLPHRGKHPDSRLPAFRTVRESIAVALSHRFVVLCWDSPDQLIPSGRWAGRRHIWDKVGEVKGGQACVGTRG